MGIGDELMVTGMAREAQATDPRRVRVLYEKGKHRWCPLWDNNPRIARPEHDGDFQVLRPRLDYLRPYCAEKTPTRWTWKEYTPPVGEIYFHRFELAFGDVNKDAVVLGCDLKRGAAPGKGWPSDHWGRLALALKREGFRPITIGEPIDSRPFADHVVTTIREAAAVISRARLVITQEGALHHIAAAVGAPAVVIFGGYISPRVTGYAGQVSFFRGDGLGCGARTVCQHCIDAMAAISPDEVFASAVVTARNSSA